MWTYKHVNENKVNEIKVDISHLHIIESSTNKNKVKNSIVAAVSRRMSEYFWINEEQFEVMNKNKKNHHWIARENCLMREAETSTDQLNQIVVHWQNNFYLGNE